MTSQQLSAALICAIGVWFLFRGIKLKSKPRLLVGFGTTFLGVAQLFDKSSSVGTALLAIGFMLIVTSIYAFKIEGGRIMRPRQRRGRR